MPNRNNSAISYFLHHIQERTYEANKCLEWPFSRRQKKIAKNGEVWLGYGQVFYEGKNWNVHKLAYVLTFGNVAEGMCVLHSCDNTGCFNPLHLHIGTHQQNVRDMISRGRHWLNRPAMPSGTEVHNHVLDESSIRFILASYKPNTRGCGDRKIAAQLGVSRNAVRNLLRGVSYRDIVQKIKSEQ